MSRAAKKRPARPKGEIAIRDRIVDFKRVRARDLLPNPKNWRRHPKNQIAALTGLLRAVGFAGVVLARRTPKGLMLLDGHARRELAPNAKVPVAITDLTEAEADLVLATYDPIGAMAATEGEALRDLLVSIKTADQDVAALLERLQRTAAAEIPREGDADAAPALPRVASTVRGDLWLLGPHRLLCGDSTSAPDLARLFGGQRAVLCNTDPPYGVKYGDIANSRDRAQAKRKGKGAKNYGTRDDKRIANDELDGAQLQAFLEAVLRTALPHLEARAAYYLWHPMLTQGTFFAAAAADILVHRQIVWVKPSLILGRGDYHWRHELCFYGWVRGQRCRWFGARNQDTVWVVGREGGTPHPTQKPVELFERPIKNHTRRGDIVYEPFSGSGSQLVAAESLGRRCFAMELDPRWVDVAVKRWEAFTGQKAVRERAKGGRAA